MEKIAIIGTDYIGLVTGACLAQNGNSVICFDRDSDRIKSLKNANSFINEPGLDELLKSNILKGKIKFSDNLDKVIKYSWCIFICPTYNSNKDDISQYQEILNVSEEISKILSNELTREILILNRVKISKNIIKDINQIFLKNGLQKIYVASNPEFLTEGFAINQFMNQDKVFVETSSEWVKREIVELYSSFINKTQDIIFIDEKDNTDSISSDELEYEGSCFMPNETINVAFDKSYRKITFEELWDEYSNEEVQKTENFELINVEDKDLEVLGFDFGNYVFENQKVYYITRRKYDRDVLYYETKNGHKQMLTLDHPIIFNSEQNIPTLCLAKDIKIGQNIFTYDENKLPFIFNLDEIIKLDYIQTPSDAVYSIETYNETVITENGIISHNCSPSNSH